MPITPAGRPRPQSGPGGFRGGPLSNEQAMVGESVDFGSLISAMETGQIDPEYAQTLQTHGFGGYGGSGTFLPVDASDVRHSFASGKMPKYEGRQGSTHTGAPTSGITKLGWGPPQGQPGEEGAAVYAGGYAGSAMGRATISQRQYHAIEKYPHLIEALGTEDGDRLVKGIIGELNQILSKKIEANTAKFSKNAAVCVADGRNIQQYFKSEEDNWVCRVTASGPFRGDEIFQYDREKDLARIVRAHEVVEGEGEDAETRIEIEDITGMFNVISDIGGINE